ncbi:MAG: hypothetical protein EPN84_01335, partial [Legionella sp.]
MYNFHPNKPTFNTMPNTVIIGAGPIGLFLAYKLYKAGIRDLVIYDPHANEYTRPGHLINDTVLIIGIKTQTYIQIPRKKGNVSWHIKDVERALYNVVSALKIPIHKKAFVRFNNDPNKKGIVISGSDQIEEIVDCDYVFDCTGSSRRVVHAVNATLPAPVFSLQPLCSKINAKRHLLAYVKISETDLATINTHNSKRTELLESSYFVGMMDKLHSLGWHEFEVPRCYGVAFGPNKACIYVECPDDLRPEQYEVWLKAAISARISNIKEIPVEQLPNSKKHEKKPRLTAFTTDPQELTTYFHSSEQLPTVIPVGDSQIDPHYFLADGIHDGMDRVGALLAHIICVEGKMAGLNVEPYSAELKQLLQAHKERIKEHFQEREEFFTEGLKKAKIHYQKMCDQAPNYSTRLKLGVALKEIEARMTLNEATAELCELASPKDTNSSVLLEGKLRM